MNPAEILIYCLAVETAYNLNHLTENREICGDGLCGMADPGLRDGTFSYQL